VSDAEATGDDESWDDEDHPTAGRAGDVLAYLAAQLVDDPDSVRIETSPARSGVKLSLRAAGAGDGLDVLVDIVD
jgi:hypothetical protein